MSEPVPVDATAMRAYLTEKCGWTPKEVQDLPLKDLEDLYGYVLADPDLRKSE
jgi:hypothetical protein